MRSEPLPRIGPALFAGAIALAAFIVVAAGCGSPNSSESDPRPTRSEAEADVSFLIEGCLETGFHQDGCQCLGDRARRELAPELIDKIREAPDDDDLEAVEEYYSGTEVQTIVSFLQATSEECEIEEAG